MRRFRRKHQRQIWRGPRDRPTRLNEGRLDDFHLAGEEVLFALPCVGTGHDGDGRHHIGARMNVRMSAWSCRSSLDGDCGLGFVTKNFGREMSMMTPLPAIP